MIRQIKLAKNIIASNFSTLKRPYKLTFILTYKCNCKCRMCLIWKKSAQVNQELRTAEIERFFKNNSYFSWVNVSGGEIFLREDISDIIKIISDNLPYLYLFDFPTNGILTEKIVKTVKDALVFLKSMFVVTVSIDGPPHLHDKIRNFPGAWEKAIDTFLKLRSIKKRNFKVFLGLTISAFNEDYLEETYESLRKAIPGFSFKDIHLNISHVSEHYYNNVDIPVLDKEKAVKAIRNFQRHKGVSFSRESFLENIYQNRVSEYLSESRTPLPCKALNASCFVDPYGEVYPCSGFGEKLGALRSTDFELEPIWNSSLAEKAREKIKDKQCPQCWTPCEAYQSVLGNLFFYEN
ncbi:MAG: radical SAM protein [Candidatus Omnitrophota bacterium]